MNSDDLIQLGFIDLAVWASNEDTESIEYFLDCADQLDGEALLNSKKALYAFVAGEEVLYIGKTIQSVKKRLIGYQNPHPSQKTNWRCNGKIKELLKKRKSIRIFVFRPDTLLHYGKFEINLSAGLEDSLISTFSPRWNGGDKDNRTENYAAGAGNSIQKSGDGVSEIVGKSIYAFQIKLGEAYYNQGIINPGIDASHYLGDDGEEIKVLLGGSGNVVFSKINRRANTGNSVRIVGSNSIISSWFKKHFKFGETVQARVINRNTIKLCLE